MRKINIFIQLILAGGLFFTSCKKQEFSIANESDFIEVKEENSSVIYHFSSTSSANSGTTGYTQFENLLSLYDSTDVVVTLTEGNVGNANNDTIFSANSLAYGVLSTSSFRTNFGSGTESQIALQESKSVLANSAYELEITPTKIFVNTTTQFFQDNVTGEEFFLTPYIVVDSLVADQTGHPDGIGTNHRKVVTEVARLKNYPVRYMGYSIASGTIYAGQRFNLAFEADRSPDWIDPEQISVALILTKKDANGIITFVNANTNH